MEEGPVQKTQAVWIVCSVDTTGGNFRSLYDTVINWIQGSAAHCLYLSHLFLISSKGVRTKQDNGEGLKMSDLHLAGLTRGSRSPKLILRLRSRG